MGRRRPGQVAKGNQEKFKIPVQDRKEFQDSLPDVSPNKIPPQGKGIVLKSQLYGQASKQCAVVTKEQLRSKNGVNLIINAIYRRDFMSVILEAYENFSALINLRRDPAESLRTFETRYSAAVAKFNFFSSTKKLLQCITSLVLLNNASIEHSQRVSALSAAAPTGTAFSDKASTDNFLKVLTYS